MNESQTVSESTKFTKYEIIEYQNGNSQMHERPLVRQSNCIMKRFEKSLKLKVIVTLAAQISRNLRRPILDLHVTGLEVLNVHFDLFLLRIQTVEGDLRCRRC